MQKAGDAPRGALPRQRRRRRRPARRGRRRNTNVFSRQHNLIASLLHASVSTAFIAEKRAAEAARIREKYPDRVPVRESDCQEMKRGARWEGRQQLESDDE